MQDKESEKPRKGYWLEMKYVYACYICIFSMGYIMVIDSPGPLQHSSIERYNLTSKEYTMMYSISCWPSFLDIMNGFIIDKYLGLRGATLIYTTILTIGSFLYAISGFTQYFFIMIIGRFIFGLGGNPLMICMNGYILHWFKGKVLNTVFSFQISILWLGSSFAFLVFYRLFQYLNQFPNVPNAYGLTISSTVFAITLVMVGCLLPLASAYSKDTDSAGGDTLTSEKNKDGGIALLSFPLAFWILVLSSFVYYMAVLNFVITSEVYFSSKYGISIGSASTMAGFLGVLTCLFSPIFGCLIDKLGRNLSFITLGVVLGMASHAIYAFTDWNPIIPLVLMALSSTLSTFVFPVVNYMVHRHQISTAYGLAQTVLSGSLAVGSQIAGLIIDCYGYAALERFYFCSLAASLPGWCLIWYLNYKTGNVMNMTAIERQLVTNARSSKASDDFGSKPNLE